MKNLKTIFCFFAAAVLAAGCSTANEKGQDTAAVTATASLPKVVVTECVKSYVPVDETYSTTIQANIVNNITPQTSGRIQKLNVEVGDFVKAGQILAEMDRVQLDQAALKLKNSETDLDRVKKLLQKGGISQSDYDQIELSYKVSKSSYDNLLENTILRAPVDAVVTARNFDRGDMYSMTQPIYTTQQIVPVKLLVGVSETDYTMVKKGQNVTVEADAIPGKTFSGKVNRIYPTMDASSHTFNVEVLVANKDRILRPGMFARATIDFGSRNSIVLPDAALLKQQGSSVRYVFVIENGAASVRNVIVGRHYDSKYEILSGLEEGETVVVKGNVSLKAGQKVEVTK